MNKGVVALMLACAAAAAPSDRSGLAADHRAVPHPATQPGPAIAAAALRPPPGPGPLSLPDKWSLLIRRSIFSRGGVPAPVPGAPGPADAAGPDGHIALRGVVLEDN